MHMKKILIHHWDSVLSSSYGTGHTLLRTEMLVCKQANISLVGVTELHSFALNYAQTSYMAAHAGSW